MHLTEGEPLVLGGQGDRERRAARGRTLDRAAQLAGCGVSSATIRSMPTASATASVSCSGPSPVTIAVLTTSFSDAPAPIGPQWRIVPSLIAPGCIAATAEPVSSGSKRAASTATASVSIVMPVCPVSMTAMLVMAATLDRVPACDQRVCGIGAIRS
jgi:hypothetical protein